MSGVDRAVSLSEVAVQSGPGPSTILITLPAAAAGAAAAAACGSGGGGAPNVAAGAVCVELPCRVRSAEGTARLDREKRQLVLRLPCAE